MSESSPIDLAQLNMRETVDGDLAAITRIRSDLRVSVHQYRSPRSAPNNAVVRGWRVQSVTLLWGSQVIGHISHMHQQATVICGWNLDPEFWGRGIMAQSLTILLTRFFDREGVGQVIVECFADNERCQRLLHRLCFVQVSIPIIERVSNAYLNRSLRWNKRFQLDAHRWRRYGSQYP
ncbi:MAG: GNAT family N-acetyltransferase [bacterium]|nr:GNAT family N-acetyltransferase [bacterium]